jgi:hypothetical protein
MKGGYSGSTGPFPSPGDVLASRLGDKLVWSLGTKQNDTDMIAAAVATVAAPDVDIALVFVQDTYVGEQADRTDIALTFGQQELVRQVGDHARFILLCLTIFAAAVHEFAT